MNTISYSCAIKSPSAVIRQKGMENTLVCGQFFIAQKLLRQHHTELVRNMQQILYKALIYALRCAAVRPLLPDERPDLKFSFSR